VAVTSCAFTAPCVAAARAVLEAAGCEVVVFDADGAGGRAMEARIRGGTVRGVLDLTTAELADELVGGLRRTGPDRLTAAALRGVPQVICPGALDGVHLGPPESVTQRYHGRRLFHADPATVLVRTTPEENDALGREIAHKASASAGPVAVLLPLRGVSALDTAGGPFLWPEADAALFQSLRNWMSPRVRLVEVDLHLNDPAFAALAARTLLEFLGVAHG
jgi:uncharacterized protein (UPF0261 family)